MRGDAVDLGLFYIIVGQFFFRKLLKLVPISGFAGGSDLFEFLVLPILIGSSSRLGSEALLYRAMFLEEIGKDYVRTARAKGLSETVVLFRHVLRNALIPILTSAVAVLPLVFLGSLVFEWFFGIPGLGGYTIDAINAQDFAIVRSMVFVGSVLYIVGLILIDISYTVADPRVRLALDDADHAEARLPLDRRRALGAGRRDRLVRLARAAHADLRATWRKVLRDAARDVGRGRAARCS